MKRLLLIVLPLLLIVGCSKPVNESSLVDRNGVKYQQDSQKPYSGEVFRLYDTGEKLYQGIYENGLLVSYSFLNKDGSVKEPVNGENLIDRSGLMYEVNGQKPYTGDVFELFENGNKEYFVRLKGGKKDELQTSWYKNGQKKYEETWKDGKPDGLYNEWYENGQKYREINYKDGKLDGLYNEWYENGQKSEEVNYKEDEKDGLYNDWYKNGQKRKEGTYKDGKLISLKKWNVDGSMRR